MLSAYKFTSKDIIGRAEINYFDQLSGAHSTQKLVEIHSRYCSLMIMKIIQPLFKLHGDEWLAAYKIKLQGGWMGVRVGGNLRWLEDCFAQSKSYKK